MLDEITEIDINKKTVHVGAGARWEKLLTQLESQNFTFPVYPSSAPSATIGGWLATGGYGIGSLKHGPVIKHVKDITVVTPDGQTIKLNADKDSDRFKMFFDSEGTLGVITEATLKIQHKSEKIKSVLCSFRDYQSLIVVLKKVVDEPIKPFFIEIQDSEYLELKRTIGIECTEELIKEIRYDKAVHASKSLMERLMLPPEKQIFVIMKFDDIYLDSAYKGVMRPLYAWEPPWPPRLDASRRSGMSENCHAGLLKTYTDEPDDAH